MNPPAQFNESAGRRREARRAVAVMALMVVAAFAVWQVWTFAVARWGGRRLPPPAPPATTGPAAPLEWLPAGPVDLIASPLKAAGLSPLEADPAGIAPPAGSRRLNAVQRRLSGQVEQQARYDCPLAPADAAAHYRGGLQARGFRLHKDVVEPTGRRMLVFWKDSAYATVALRNDPRQDKMVMVVLTVVTVGASDGPR